MPSIVQVNVSQQVAPTPPTLQQTGAFISQGGTNTAPNTLTLLTQLSDLTPVLNGSKTLSSLAWATNVVTATTSAPHGFTNGDTIELTIAGAAPTGYNGTFPCTITGATTFTYPLATNPGTETTPGSYTPEDVAELNAMANTFFAQGASVSVYVLELGAGTVAEGVTALTSYITANPGTIYSYLVPRTWDADTSFVAFLANYESTTAKTYFFVTTTLATYSNYTATMKDVVTLIEATGIPSTEFSLAAAFYRSLSYNPSNTNKLQPFAFSYVYGVTPYPTKGNSATLATLKTAGVNVIGTGAEGGISNTILLWGTTMDLHDFQYWFSVDWLQIQADLAIANAVINGSNNPLNPLIYNQDGINRLQAVLAGVGSNAVTFGCAIGTVTQTELDGTTLGQQMNAGAFTNQLVINAVPFVTYATDNPGDYKIGKYAGLSVIYIPARGFTAIVINVLVTDFVTQ